MENDMTGYSATLKGGQEIYIPSWPASVALENLTKAGEFIGSNALVSIAKLNTPAAMLAIMSSKDSTETAGLIKHFVCSARMDEKKIEHTNYDSQFEGNLSLAIEIFCHVVKATYSDFFEQGLAEEPSQES